MNNQHLPHTRDATTFVELLRGRAHVQPQRLAYTFLLDGETPAGELTYTELDRQARSLAALLQTETQPGDRALLLYPPGLDYIVAFFGCLYAGVTAVPAYPPQSANLERALSQRLRAMTQDARPTVALTTTSALPIGTALAAQDPVFQAVRWLATDQLDAALLSNQWQAPDVMPTTLAFLQYTSGSTATPKGVMVSHRNLLHNSRLIAQGYGHTEDSRGVIWLPPYHDMGLIGGILQPLYAGFPVTLMAPMAFLQRPLRWLEAITRYGATTSGGPNFAYDLCARKITPEQKRTLDLSTWRVAFNGAEPVRAATLEQFAAAFAECGFRREAFYPCYGLAEATLIVTGGGIDAPPVTQIYDGTALEQHRVREIALDSTSDQATARALVGCGLPLLDQQIAIVNPQSRVRCGPDEVGEIWVCGPSVAQGYWQRAEETAHTFGATLADHDGESFMRTGDLGFVRNGELFVTGRLKDLIIIRGRNHYPQDIELTVERSHMALHPGSGAAFTVEIAGEERLVVVQELERQHRRADPQAVSAAIRQAVAAEHDVQVYAVVLLKPGHLPKTTSGKVQRHACRAAFMAGTLESIASSVLDASTTTAVALPELTRELLASHAPEQQRAQLVDYLVAHIAHLAHADPAAIAVEQPITTLGIDSLMAVELQHRVAADLDVEMSMVSFLQAPTILALADEILGALATPPSETTPATAEMLDAGQRLSAGQRALWLLHQLAPNSAAYTIPTAVCVRGSLDVVALRRAFQRLVDRHPTLRTVFDAPHGEPLQYVQEQAQIAFEFQNATGWSAAVLDERLMADVQRPFDLQRGPLLRLALFKRGADEHILLLTVHHIIADLWSLAVLMQELAVLYPAEQAGATDLDTALLPIQRAHYTDYVQWQERMLSGSIGEQLWASWWQRLADAPTVLDLPTDRPRPLTQTFTGAALPFQLDARLSQQLKALAEAEGTTLYMLLLAAFNVLLYHMTGQDDLLIGSPVAGRSRAEYAGTVGYFVNPVVLRTRLIADQPFRSLLAQVRQTVLDALAQQDLPFGILVERLQPTRDPARSPVFQVMFAWQKAPLLDEVGTAIALGETASMPLGDVVFEALPLEQRAAQFDLSLAMGETDGRIAAMLEYNTDLFDAATIQAITTRLQTVLDAIANDPELAVGDVPVLADAELRRVTVEPNATAAELPGPTCIHDWVAAQASATPGAPALIFGDQRLTYRELDERANQVAHYLQARGVGPEVLVGLLVERSVELIVGVLGILKAGGAYIPLDPAYPAERIRAMLTDAQAPLLLCQAQLLELVPATAAEIVCLDRDWPQIAAAPVTSPSHHAVAASAACVIYTSGSTGQPKGVVLQHGSIVNLVESFAQSYQPTSADRMLPLTSLAAATFVGEIFPPLCTGGTLVLPNTVEVFDIEALYTLIARHDVSIISTVPALLSRLNAGSAGLPKLRLILSGGEALTSSDVDRLHTRVALANGYGLTETTVCSTSYLLPPGWQAPSGPIPIGGPIVNTQVYVLDQRLRPVPLGCYGELYVGGLGLARAYVNDPALTAARFVPDPFGPLPGGRLYRTGDRARWRPDGTIEYVGRIDQQVKVRGFRVELGEIEAVLLEQPGVQEAVVVARDIALKDGASQQRLVAYLVPTPDHTPTAAELRTTLRARLPEYMLPATFVLLPALPLSPNGKVDRKALPAPDAQSQAESGIAHVTPRSDLERTIAAVWQSVLQVEHVGVHDNFFDLGGHSLLLVQVHSALRQSFDSLVLLDLFQYPTISALAAHISAAQTPADSTFDEEHERARKQRANRNQRQHLLRSLSE